MKRVTDEQVIAAYRATGSIWKAAKTLGIVGQSVHERLRALGYRMAHQKWTRAEEDELRGLVGQVTIGEAARRLGRTYAATALKISRLGLSGSPAPRAVKIPRGAGYDKASVTRHMRDLEVWKGSFRQYCRANGIDVEGMSQAIQRNDLKWWDAYVAAHSDLPQLTCPYCGRIFIPANGKQRHCSRRCTERARVDKQYFGGRRRTAIGMAEQTCQLCGRQGIKGLSAHHVVGKENDPNDELLVALCPGCHKIVSLLATRTQVDEPAFWEALIPLVASRRHAFTKGVGTFVSVDFEWLSESDVDELIESQSLSAQPAQPALEV